MSTPLDIVEAIAKALDDSDITIGQTDHRVSTPAACGCPGCDDYGPDVIFVEGRAYAITLTEVTR